MNATLAIHTHHMRSSGLIISRSKPLSITCAHSALRNTHHSMRDRKKRTGTRLPESAAQVHASVHGGHSGSIARRSAAAISAVLRGKQDAHASRTVVSRQRARECVEKVRHLKREA